MPVSKQELVQALTLSPDDLDEGTPIDLIEAGLRTLIVPIAHLETEISVYPQEGALKAFCLSHNLDNILIFSRETKNAAAFAHTRVFAPKYGYLEDPATGSANSAFANYLLKYSQWNGEPITLEQGGDNIEFNPVKLRWDGKNVWFGGSATVIIDGMYHVS